MSSSMLSPAAGSTRAVSAVEYLPPRQHALKILNLAPSMEEVHIVINNVGSVQSQQDIAAIRAYCDKENWFNYPLVPIDSIVEYRTRVIAAHAAYRQPGDSDLVIRSVEDPEVQRIIKEGSSIASPPVVVEEKSSVRAASCMDYILVFFWVVVVLTVLWYTPFRLLSWSIQQILLGSASSFQFLVRYALRLLAAVFSWSLDLWFKSADILTGAIVATLTTMRLHWQAHAYATIPLGLSATVAVTFLRWSPVQSARVLHHSDVAASREVGVMDIASVSVSVPSPSTAPSSESSPTNVAASRQVGFMDNAPVSASVPSPSAAPCSESSPTNITASRHVGLMDNASVSVSVSSPSTAPSSGSSPTSLTVTPSPTRHIPSELRASRHRSGDSLPRQASSPARPSRDTSFVQPPAPDPDGFSWEEYKLQVLRDGGDHRGPALGPLRGSRRAPSIVSSRARATLDPPDEFRQKGKSIGWRANEVRTFVKGSSPLSRFSRRTRIAVPAPTILRLPPVESTPVGLFAKELPSSFWEGDWKPVLGPRPISPPGIPSAAPSIPPSPNPFDALFVDDDDEDNSAMYDGVFVGLEACLPSAVEGGTDQLSEQCVPVSRLPQWKSEMLSKRAARKRRLKDERAAERTRQAGLVAHAVAEAALVEDQCRVARTIASAVGSVNAPGGSTEVTDVAVACPTTLQAPCSAETADVAPVGDAVPFDELLSDLSGASRHGTVPVCTVPVSCPTVSASSGPPGRNCAAATVEDVAVPCFGCWDEKEVARAEDLPAISVPRDESLLVVVNKSVEELQHIELAEDLECIGLTDGSGAKSADLPPANSIWSKSEDKSADRSARIESSTGDLERIELRGAEELERIGRRGTEELEHIELRGAEELERIEPSDAEESKRIERSCVEAMECIGSSESVTCNLPSGSSPTCEPSARAARVVACPSIVPARPSIVVDTPSVCAARHTIALPKIVAALLANPAKHAIPSSFQPSLEVAVADSGATDHMVPDRSAFYSYRPVHGLRVRMGNNAFVPVVGRGTAVFSLNGKHVMIRNVMHVPDLGRPLYSLRAHLLQPGCGFIGLSATETSARMMCVYFPTFVLTVDMSKDCHLSYEPVGRSARPDNMAYVQPKCKPYIYPSERRSSASLSAVPSSTSLPSPIVHVIEDDEPSVEENGGTRRMGGKPSGRMGGQVANPNTPVLLQRAEYERIQNLIRGMKEMLHNNKTYNTPLSNLSDKEFIQRILLPLVPGSPSKSASKPDASARLLSGMSKEEIATHLHQAGAVLPKVRPCDTPNGSDKKTTYSQQELTMAFGG
ncbi:hypothetical protein THAOC_05551, partial [Thalassiosira oceanica]